MTDSSINRRFAGQARLIRLLLWRIGDSTDLSACFVAARASGMLTEDDEDFLRYALDLEETCRDNPADLGDRVDSETVKRLFRCADKLNRADSA